MSLDERFRPTRVADAIAGACLDSGDEPVVGTLDALYSFPEEGMMLDRRFCCKNDEDERLDACEAENRAN
jgi:hypothetical protein